ncbi:MAG TPA: hypothetical protein DHV36_19650 [Desulfobacteraceae bacterium]|nr:hypothetical protein [Desulfobacteraceae bacterium]
MRFLLSLLIWIIMVGGMWMYTWQRDRGLPEGPSQPRTVETVAGEFVLEVTPTFSMEKDPFALDTGADDAAVTLALNGDAVPFSQERFARGQQLRIDGLTGLHAGMNEIFVKASPPASESHMDHALRVRVTDRGFVIVDRTVWGGRGALVSGTVSFELTDHKEDDHGQ